MVIDLRTEEERTRNPRFSDIQVEIPKPPLGTAAICWAARTLLDVAIEYDFNGEPVQVFCAKGIRSALAASILRASGYKVIDLGGA